MGTDDDGAHGRGFLGALFEFRFDELITIQVSVVGYAVAVWLIAVGSVIGFGFGIWLWATSSDTQEQVIGMVTAAGSVVLFLPLVLLTRLAFELTVVLFRIERNTRRWR